MAEEKTESAAVNTAEVAPCPARVIFDEKGEVIFEEEAHHLNGPSSLKRREACPRSARLEAMLRNWTENNKDAQRGTRIHAAVAHSLECLRDGMAPSSRLNDEAYTSLDDDEMALHNAILEFMEGEATYYGFDVHEYRAETRLEYRNLTGVLYYGTCDLLIVDLANKVAYLYDWKTGFRKVDDAENNLQGAAYALAAAQMFNVDTVHTTFFNPAIRQLTRFTFDEEALLSAATQIECIIARTLDPNAPFCPGEEQCRFCKGALSGTCSAYLAQFQATAAMARPETLVPISEMTDDALAYALEQCKAVEKLQKAVETEMKLRIAAAGSCAGWTIKTSSGGREATDVDGIYNAVQEYYSPAEFFNFCTLSVSKLEKDVAKKIKASGRTASEKDAKELFGVWVAPYVSDKAPRQVLTSPAALVAENAE